MLALIACGSSCMWPAPERLNPHLDRAPGPWPCMLDAKVASSPTGLLQTDSLCYMIAQLQHIFEI